MKILHTYEDFIERVNNCGFMTLSDVLTGLPSLSEETEENKWHTGDKETDPWLWRIRCAKEKKLAFGCIIGGHKGFVSAEMYSTFYKAYHPTESMATRYESGHISQTLWTLWNLFNDKGILSTKDIRDEMGITKKKGGSAVDTAIKHLQKEYYITVVGNKRKINKLGEPYGWPANTYDKISNWLPEKWSDISSSLTQEKAREEIVERGIDIGVDVDKRKLIKVLKF